MPSPSTTDAPVEPQLGRWATTSNRRRWVEESLAVLAATAAAILTAVGLRRLPAAATHLGWDLQDAADGLALAGFALVCAVGLAMMTRAWLRYRRQRIDQDIVARRLDRRFGTSDLFATALAVEAGRIGGNPGLEHIVMSRARHQLPGMPAPIRRFEAPLRTFAGVGAVAAVVSMLPGNVAAHDDATGTASDEAKVVAAPPLPDEVLERLQRHAAQLERMEYTPGLHDEAEASIREARQHLEALGKDEGDDRNLSELARAAQALDDAQRRARADRLYDASELSRMDGSELAEQLTKALERGETDTAAAMADEFARRLEDASPNEQERIARALERALRRNTPSDPPGLSRSESEARARERNRLDEAAERLSDGQSGAARSDLEQLADEMRRRGGSDSLEQSLGEAAEDVRRARQRQLDRMNGQDGQDGADPGQQEGQKPGNGQSEGEGEGQGQGNGQSPGEGQGEGQGEGGDRPARMGVPFSRPGEKPGPGGGDGVEDTKGAIAPSADASGLAPQRVEARRTGEATGSVRAIQRFSQGHRDAREYEALHDKYSSVAESAVQREEIPLTRRDYIRNYFQAVRGNKGAQ